MQTKRTSKVFLVFLTLVCTWLAGWALSAGRSATNIYAGIAEQLASESSVMSSVVVGESKLVIPSWQLFHDGEPWSLVSAEAPLSKDFTPSLVPAPVDHTNGDLKITNSIVGPLITMFEAAKKDGVYLMLSSAYRSQSDQQAIYNSYLRTQGQDYVDAYVALPGTSEHQTGLAVDISSKSNACRRAASECTLEYEAIIWLRDNAADYGFIQRYPSGKQSITGIAGEAWHYRYVGTALSRLLDESGLTLDEFVQQVAPGFAR